MVSVQVMRRCAESSATPDLSLTQLRWNVSNMASEDWRCLLYVRVRFGIIITTKQNHPKTNKKNQAFL